MLSYAQRISVFMIAATGLFAQTTTQETRTSGVVGIAQGQAARFNVLRPNESATAVCSAVLTYFDAAGTVLKTATVTVAPGQAGYLDLFSDTDLSLATNQRRQIRATFSVPAITPTSASDKKDKPVCRLIGTLEIFDELTGRTSVVLGGMHRIETATATPAAN
ncbi:MAG TPA: hypothetical protein VHY84_02000 [Bryobacteraceae bacterium]|nr:hypothetical protein [Bryobacteraceae bacterium]